MVSSIIRNFIAKRMFQQKGAIANNKSVEFSANALEQRLKNLGVDPNTIKSEGELNQILSFVKQAEDQAFNQKFGNALSGNKFQKKAEVVDLKNKKLDTEKPILGGTQETDEQMIQRFKKQNEDSINRLKNKKKPEDMAGGGVAGLLGERTGYEGGLRADAPNPRILELMLNEKMSYEDALKEFEMREKQRPYIEERMGTGPGPILEAASGGIARTPFKMGKRAFLKFMGAGAAGIAGLKTGLFGLGKKAAVKEVAKEVATGGPPPHFFKLVAKIKSLGDDATPKYGAQPREKVTSYKDYTLSEELDSGRTTIQRFKQSEVDYYDEMLMEDVYMSHTPGKGLADETTKGRYIPDEYVEDTSYMRTSGPQKGDILETVNSIPDDIFKEVGEVVPEAIRKGKADGGRIGYAVGNKVIGKGIMAGINKLFGKGTMTTADKIKIPQKTLDRNMFKNFETKFPETSAADTTLNIPVQQEGKFTKAEYLIQRLENTIKESPNDKYVKKTFPGFIKELKANPELAKNENVFKELGGDLPEGQQIVVYGDDTLDFFTQKSGPGNIDRLKKLTTQYPSLSREKALKIMKMEPNDQVMELKMLEIANRTVNSNGGLAAMLGE